jgi:hypothetical protein
VSPDRDYSARQYGGLTVKVFADAERAKIRNARGWFSSMSQQVVPAHEKMAESLAKAIAAELTRRVEGGGRAQVTRNRHGQSLAELICNPANRIIKQDSFQVMIPQFLNEGPARGYWKGLEVGSDAHVGQTFPGYFLAAGSWHRQGPRSEHHDPILVRVKAGTTGKKLSGEDRASLKRGEWGQVRSWGKAPQVGHAQGAGPGRARGARGEPIATPAGEQLRRGGGTPARGRPGSKSTTVTGARVWEITIRNRIRPYEYIATGARNWNNARTWEPILQDALDLAKLRALGIEPRFSHKPLG